MTNSRSSSGARGASSALGLGAHPDRSFWGWSAPGRAGVPGRRRGVRNQRSWGDYATAAYGPVTGVLGLSPHVGNVLKISVFRDRAACRDTFSATNTSTHRVRTVTVRTPCTVVYRHAELGATMTDISGTWKPPAQNVRLWKLQNTAITSYNGTRGTICGPWPAEKHLAAPVITIRMIPSGISNGCRDFSVLLKGAAKR